MLKEIHIRNFVLIEALDLEFSGGFNVFTGETGAGKSIILDALSVVLGEKADTSFIREGTKRASIEAVFDYGSRRDEITEILEREDLMPEDDDDELILAREIRDGGRSTARVNGSAVSIAVVQELGALLVDIHGQSEHLSLLKPASHIRLVDQFAGNGDLLKEYRGVYKKYLAVSKELRELRSGEEEALRQQDILNYQLNEITSAELSADEEEKLQKDRERFANAEKIIKSAHQGLQALNGRSEERPGIIDQLSVLEDALDSMAGYDETLQPLCEAVVTAADQLNDVLDALQKYKASLGYSPRKVNQIEERMQLYFSLKRKYGGTVEAVLEFAENAKRKLGLITNADARAGELETERQSLLDRLAELAAELSEKRTAAAKLISQGVEKELDDLRMPSAKFEVTMDRVPAEDGLADKDGKTWALAITVTTAWSS